MSNDKLEQDIDRLFNAGNDLTGSTSAVKVLALALMAVELQRSPEFSGRLEAALRALENAVRSTLDDEAQVSFDNELQWIRGLIPMLAAEFGDKG